MCGIVGGTSNRNILPILVEGLRRLEYRGYDSAGVAYKANGKISLVKNEGRVEDLADKLNLDQNSAEMVMTARMKKTESDHGEDRKSVV